jgi:hypothetical protein
VFRIPYIVSRKKIYNIRNTSDEIRTLRFEDLAGADTTGAHVSAFDCSIKIDLDPLQVGQKTAEAFPDDLGTGAAGPFDLAAAFIFGAWYRAFLTDNTLFRHDISSLKLN